MRFPLLAVIFTILALMFSGMLNALTTEFGVLSSCFLIGGLTVGPPTPTTPGTPHFF